MKRLLLLLSSWVVVAVLGDTPDTAYDVDVKRYSYICLQANQELCLGVSPGNDLPVYDPPRIVHEIQLKNRKKNEYTNQDYKKTRWDVDFVSNLIKLSRFSNLCMSKELSRSGKMFLIDCSVAPDANKLWNISFSANVNQASTLQLVGTNLCATVMRCENGPNTWCNPNSNNPVTGNEFDNFDNGAYLRLKECYYEGGNPAWAEAQIFRQRLDCAIGCSPFLELNDVCDQECANDACNFDGMRCITPSPTPPTNSPTKTPTTKAPTQTPTTGTPTTEQPTTLAPSRTPTTRRPSTGKPTTAIPTTSAPTTLQPTTSEPTKKPTTKSPTKLPTFKPTFSPTTKKPSTENPTRTPSIEVLKVPISTQTPTVPPTKSPLELETLLIFVLSPICLLLLLFCCLLACVCRRRQRRRALKDKKNWGSSMTENHHLFEDYRRKRESEYTGCCCTRCFASKEKKQRQYEISAPTTTTLATRGFLERDIMT